MLDDMVAHIIRTQNKSLLARIYGVFTIKSKLFSDMDVILMQNTTSLSKSTRQLCFDLKGSSINRKVKLPQSDLKFWQKSLWHKKCLKDLNFLDISNDLGYSLIDIDKESASCINSTLAMDSKFLMEHGILDYSMLLVIDHC